MIHLFLQPFGNLLERWKWLCGRKYHGIWMGPPPRLLVDADLLCGDVLFCSGTQKTKLSSLIRTATAGCYSHCALYIGHRQVVDVVLGGVRIQDIEDFIEAYTYIAVGRCPGNDENPERRRALRRYAINAMNGAIKGYDFVGAALAPIRELLDLMNLENLWLHHNHKKNEIRKTAPMFCSQFVIEAYVESGYIRRDDPSLQAKRRTPTGLAEENMFTFLGYMSAKGWSGVSRSDHFLGGCEWVISANGRARLEARDRDFSQEVVACSIPKTEHSNLRPHREPSGVTVAASGWKINGMEPS